MPAVDPDYMAAVVTMALAAGDAKAAKHFGVSRRTVRRYRSLSGKSPEVASAVRASKDRMMACWREQIDQVLASSLDYVQRCAENMGETPEGLEAVTGAMSALAEIQQAERFLDVRLNQAPGGDGSGVVSLAERRRAQTA